MYLTSILMQFKLADTQHSQILSIVLYIQLLYLLVLVC